MIFRFNEQTHLKNKQELAIGAFDAFHRGHQKLLENLSPECAAVTLFSPLPAQIFKEDFEGCVCSFTQRCEIAQKLGIDNILHIDFSKEFSRMLGEDFLSGILSCMPLKKIVVGWDFRMGRNRSFSADDLSAWGDKHGIEIKIVREVKDGSDAYSTSAVRADVLNGRFTRVKEVLGRPCLLDLREIPVERSDSLFVADLRACSQVLPPEGKYETNAGEVLLSKEGLTLAVYVEECEFKRKLD